MNFSLVGDTQDLRIAIVKNSLKAKKNTKNL